MANSNVADTQLKMLKAADLPDRDIGSDSALMGYATTGKQ
jgi:hypothetical protein